jgi:hypothetical protein
VHRLKRRNSFVPSRASKHIEEEPITMHFSPDEIKILIEVCLKNFTKDGLALGHER